MKRHTVTRDFRRMSDGTRTIIHLAILALLFMAALPVVVRLCQRAGAVSQLQIPNR
jgi:hypothetical protein